MLHFKIEFNDTALQSAFKELVARGTNMRPLMFEIGGELQRTTRENFDGQHDPDGKPWDPISAAWKARKAKLGGSSKILRFRGLLRKTIVMDVGENTLELNTIQPYARVHQLGGGSKKMRKRTFIGVSEDNKNFIREAAADYLRNAVETPAA